MQLVKKNGLRVFVHSVYFFHAFYNRNGDTDPKLAFKRCRSRWYTPMLREGKIHVCPKPATIGAFNEKYDLHIPQDGFVDLYEPDINGWDIKERLNKAASTCRYCTLGWDTIPVFPWATSNLVLQDWDASTNKT
jgi:hypothetical protein